MTQHRENPACAICHLEMDAIGFAMENFDAVGRWRTLDGGHPIDAHGQLPTGESFSGVTQLQTMLVNKQRDKYIRCVAEKMLTFALGRGVEYYDQCAVDAIVKYVEKNDYRFSALVIAIAKSEPFRRRSVRDR